MEHGIVEHHFAVVSWQRISREEEPGYPEERSHEWSTGPLANIGQLSKPHEDQAKSRTQQRRKRKPGHDEHRIGDHQFPAKEHVAHHQKHNTATYVQNSSAIRANTTSRGLTWG